MHSPYLRSSFFFIVLLLALTMGEVYVRSLPNPAKAKHAFLSKYATQVDVLILGSSHTYYGICPPILSKHAYNAAQVSQTLRYDDWLLHHYAFDKLKFVVQPISDFTLYENLEGGAEWYLANRYRIYMDCDIHAPYSVYAWEVTAFPIYIAKLKSLWQKPQMRWSNYGQGMEYELKSRPINWDNGSARAAHNLYTDFGAATENMAHLQNIARFCQEHGAKLLLISTPLRPSYRSSQNANQVADTQRRLQHFLHAHPEVIYHDFSADCRFTDNDFYDSDHLSTIGAKKLSQLVRQLMENAPTEEAHN